MTNSYRWLLLALCQLAAATVHAQSGAGRQDESEPVRDGAGRWRFGVDRAQVEVGRLDDNPRADGSTTLRATPYVGWQPSRQWELRLGARLEHDRQSGGSQSFSTDRIAPGEIYLRYRSGDTRLTLGSQTVIWGRVDAIPLIDRVSRVDLRRGPLDELQERRLPQPTLRWEQTVLDDYKLDLAWMPSFTPAKLPDRRSIWHPVDGMRGRIIGVPAAALPPGLIGASRIVEDDDGSGGAAIRLTHTGESFDWGLTMARARQSLPYFQIEPAAMTLRALHPYQNFIGADLEVAGGGATWRAEIGLTDGKLVTAPDGSNRRARGVDFVGAVELYPGGGNTRVNLQFVSLNQRVDGPVLELKHYHGINGEVETSFGQARWKASMRFSTGLNVNDRYVAPKLSFVGWEPHEIYVTARYFGGEERTIGGFYRDNRMLAVGLKTRF